MTSRERVIEAVRFGSPDRVPRDLWVLPWAGNRYPAELEEIKRLYPADMGGPEYRPPVTPRMKGNRHGAGEYTDEWGCTFVNIQEGVVGEVKEPVLPDWPALASLKPPFEIIGKGMENVNKSCAGSEKFMMAGCGGLFERMQFLRGTENLFIDIMEQAPGLFKLRDMVHDFNMLNLREWLKTDVDGISFSDDWGTQNALLIPPRLWRKIFKPCYAEFAGTAKKAGKLVFMHSDGHIFELYEDLIEIGVDAVNSQLFCMDIEEIGRRWKGRIAFWGEICRQHILPGRDSSAVVSAVERVMRDLMTESGGGVIAQCEFGAGTLPGNVKLVFETWKRDFQKAIARKRANKKLMVK